MATEVLWDDILQFATECGAPTLLLDNLSKPNVRARFATMSQQDFVEIYGAAALMVWREFPWAVDNSQPPSAAARPAQLPAAVFNKPFCLTEYDGDATALDRWRVNWRTWLALVASAMSVAVPPPDVQFSMLLLAVSEKFKQRMLDLDPKLLGAERLQAALSIINATDINPAEKAAMQVT